MYVCLCKAVTDSQLESAIEHGLCTRRQLFECFGVGGCWGKCNKDIRDRLQYTRPHAGSLRRATNQPFNSKSTG